MREMIEKRVYDNLVAKAEELKSALGEIEQVSTLKVSDGFKAKARSLAGRITAFVVELNRVSEVEVWQSDVCDKPPQLEQ